jgi:plasmid stabilization system protein ParE
MKIIWTYTAKKTFTKILDYLFENWTEKEINKFSKETKDALDHIAKNPSLVQVSDLDQDIKTKRNDWIY